MLIKKLSDHDVTHIYFLYVGMEILLCICIQETSIKLAHTHTHTRTEIPKMH